MQDRKSFAAAYQALEARMKAQAEADGDAFVPNLEPEGPVQWVLICMEPSLGRWARSVDHARSRVEAGFRNFLGSIETAILHFSVREYLCKPSDRYHVTDLSKGAMLVERASHQRSERYARWYDLLKEELDVVAERDAGIVAVGNAVADQLERGGFPRPYSRIIHYSGQAAAARRAGIAGREQDFAAFRGSVSLVHLKATMDAVCGDVRVPASIRDEVAAKFAKRDSALSDSQQRLLFNYKLAFEALRLSRG